MLAPRALQIATSKVGQAEIPGHPNTGGIVEWAVGEWTRREPGPWAAWCASFVSTCYLHAEQESFEPAPRGWRWHEIGSTSCHTLLSRCRARGFEILEDLAQAQPGDLIFFCEAGQRAAGPVHVGLVEKLVETTLHTIEGNSGDQVKRNTYHLTHQKLLVLARCPW